MHKMNMLKGVGLLVGAAMVALTGCERAAEPSSPIVAEIMPAQPEVAPPPAASELATSEPAAQTAAAKPAAERRAAPEPDLSSMAVAKAPSKLGAAVDLRYVVDGDPDSGLPVTVYLAAVPRVAGSNLEVSVKDEPGISTSSKIGQARVQKADASTAYRQSMSVSKQAGGPSALRVLVTMETPAGSAHSWFSVPLNAATAAQKQQTGKQQSTKVE